MEDLGEIIPWDRQRLGGIGDPDQLAILFARNVKGNSLELLVESPAYKTVQANPTPWTQKIGPQAIGRPFIRNVYTMIHPGALTPAIASGPMAPALQIGRMDVPRDADREFNEWYNTIYVPNYEKVPGVIRGRRYRAVEGAPTYLTLYEFEDPKVSESRAWQIQRDANPLNAKMRLSMHHAPGSPGVYVKTVELP